MSESTGLVVMEQKLDNCATGEHPYLAFATSDKSPGYNDVGGIRGVRFQGHCNSDWLTLDVLVTEGDGRYGITAIPLSREEVIRLRDFLSEGLKDALET